LRRLGYVCPGVVNDTEPEALGASAENRGQHDADDEGNQQERCRPEVGLVTNTYVDLAPGDHLPGGLSGVTSGSHATTSA